MVHKSLERLFPVDQSMVVVIDDRGDVWNWSPNLVKVIPCESAADDPSDVQLSHLADLCKEYFTP